MAVLPGRAQEPEGLSQDDVVITEGEDTVFQKREVIILGEGERRNTSNPWLNDVRTRAAQRQANTKGLSFTIGGFGIGYNALVEDLGNLSVPDEYSFMELKPKSITVNITFFTLSYRLHEHIKLRTGLELEVNNFRFDRNMSLMRDPETGVTVPDYDTYRDQDITLQKSKLVTGYLNVPLTVRFDIGQGKQRPFVYGGVLGGWRIITYNKIKADSEAFSGKRRYHDNLNLKNFHWGYTAGIGFGHYGVYANYYPRSIFKTGKGPSVRQVNIGFMLTY